IRDYKVTGVQTCGLPISSVTPGRARHPPVRPGRGPALSSTPAPGGGPRIVSASRNGRAGTGRSAPPGRTWHLPNKGSVGGGRVQIGRASGRERGGVAATG